MEKTVKISVDGVKHDVTVSVEDVPVFTSAADALAFIQSAVGTPEKLLKALSRVAEFVAVKSRVKDAKAAYIAQNFPGREQMRKIARAVFEQYTTKLYGKPVLLKDLRKQDTAAANELWSRAVARAKKTLSDE